MSNFRALRPLSYVAPLNLRIIRLSLRGLIEEGRETRLRGFSLGRGNGFSVSQNPLFACFRTLAGLRRKTSGTKGRTSGFG